MLDIQWNHRGQSAIRGRGGDLIFRHLSDLLGPLCQGGRGGSPGALHQPSSRNTAEVAIKLFYRCAYCLDWESILYYQFKIITEYANVQRKINKNLKEKNSQML